MSTRNIPVTICVRRQREELAINTTIVRFNRLHKRLRQKDRQRSGHKHTCFPDVRHDGLTKTEAPRGSKTLQHL